MSNKFTKHQLLLKISMVAIFLFGLILPVQSNADTYALNNDKETAETYTKIKIIAERGAIRPGDEIIIATEISIKPHWHIYWRNPGDSGIPINISWSTPEGFDISEIDWPIPDKISYDILANYGYYGKVVLLQKLKAPDVLPQGAASFKAHIDVLVCNEICIPETKEVSISLNDPENLATDNSGYIDAARSKLPIAINGQFSFNKTDKNIKLSVIPEDRTILGDATRDNMEFFPYDRGIINHLAPANVTLGNDRAIVEHERGDQPIKNKQILNGLLIIKGEIGKNIGYAISAVPTEETTSPAVVNKANTISGETISAQNNGLKDQRSYPVKLINALILAFLGGLVLNLMPCVFPVLSIKTLSLVKAKDKERKAVRLHAIAYTAGVISSFVVVAGILITLREAGATIGWGFQLQNPVIVCILSYLLFIIGLNLIGFLEIGSNLGGIGDKYTKSHSFAASFFTGALATVVATPCTAPFMGTAMGFALTQEPVVSISIFATLGLGLALPYLLLSFIPKAYSILPKPGAWMNTFKQFLAFPMFASSLWLIWVLSQQTGTYGILQALFGLLAIAFIVWVSKLKNKGFPKLLSITAIIISTLLISYTLSSINETHISGFGQPFTKRTLSKLLEGDEPVFVEMTAAWCITCKLNHSSVINTTTTRRLFADNNVQYLVGDWTNRNDEITEYLNAFERDGVPLYVYYGKRDTITKMRPKTQILPQILTSSAVRKALDSCNSYGTVLFNYTQHNSGDNSCSK